MDKLDFLKVYDWFVNPIESRGIPSLPIFLLLVVAIIGGAWFVANGGLGGGAQPKSVLQVVVADSEGKLLPDIVVSATVEGKEYLAKTNARGVALFEDLPAGAGGSIAVNAQGYDAQKKSFTAGQTQVTVTLQGGVQVEKKIALTVTDSRGEALGGVALSYLDANGETMSLETDANGRAEIAFESESDEFTVRAKLADYDPVIKTCFAATAHCEFALQKKIDLCTEPDCTTTPPDTEAKGSVTVSVVNENGDYVAARVTLYSADSIEPISTGETSDSSPAFFEAIASLGTSVYVVVEPESAEYAVYDGGQLNDLQTVSDETEFTITLQPSSEVPTNVLSYKIVDENAAPISGATLALYSAVNPLRVVATTTSDDKGEASFEIAQDASVYLVASAPGYLPYLGRDVAPGTQQTITLVALAAGNNANAIALVVDDEKNPQQLARVFLVTPDGFYVGLPPQETGADGSTEFSGVPVDGEYGFRATLGARSGASDFFTPSIDETINVTVTLEPEMGTLTVSGEDAATGDSVAGAKFEAIFADSNKTAASCVAAQANSTSNVTLYACDLRVKAGKSFFVRATEADYAPAESEQIALAPDSHESKTIKMVSLRASRELRLISFELQALNGQQDGDAKQVDKGRYYRALLTINFPGGADASAAFLRIGNKASATDEPAVFSYFDDADATVTWGTNWDESASCDSERSSQEGSEAKWINFEYPGFFGTKTIAAKVFVKPTAKTKDKVVVYYRAYSQKKDVFTRAPADADLGFNEKTSAKDSCRAQAQSKTYAITEGESECTDEACISVAFAEQDGASEGDGFKTSTNAKFEARIAIRSFTGASTASLKIAAADESLLLYDWVFGAANGGANGERTAQIPLKYDENGEAQGVVLVKALLPSQQAQLKFTLAEEGRTVASTQKFVVVEGDAHFDLSVSPENVSVQQPGILVATLKRADDGSAVEDAKISLSEADGYVFDGSPNGDYSVQGDGSEGRGKEGRYVFRRVLATSPGSFDVVAKRAGFAQVSVRMNANAVDFLEFSRDLSDVKFACDALDVSVSSILNIDVPVLASFNGVQCASLSAPGLVQKDANTWSFVVKKGKTVKIEVTPTRNGKCYLVFNSVLPNAAGAFSATAWLDVNCAALGPTVTPVANTNCTSENCGGCDEKNCIALNDSCEAKYARTPQNASVFVKCAQRVAVKPKCDAKHCELCNENECNALFDSKNCSPLYSQPKTAYELPKFVNCTKFKMPDCSPANFNFQNILARRLAQYHANLLLNPQYKSQAIGASAGTQIVYDTAGLRVARNGNKCESDGLSVTCEKSINAIVPTNGMAFSIYNQFGSLGADFGAKIKDGKQKCFRLESLDTKHPLSALASLPGDLGSALGLVPPLSTHSWVIYFLPNKDCVEYYWKNGEDGEPRLYAKPTADGESVTLLISPFKSEQAAVELTFNVVPNDDEEIAKYAFLFTPYNMYAGAGEPSGDADVQAGFFVNNLQAGQSLLLSGSELTDDKGNKQSSLLGENLPLLVQSEQVAVTRVAYKATDDAKKPVVLPISVKANGAESATPGDVELNPSAYSEDSALKCSDGQCCAKKDYDEAKAQVEAEAKEVFGKILGELEEVYDGNIVDGNAALFKKAVDDATADYMGQEGAYLVCKNLGIDPLASLKAKCSEQAGQIDYLGSNYGSDLQTQGFGEIYGDSFTETACDSSLLNYAFGTSEAIAPGGTFMDVFANRLTGALSPRSGTYYKKKYLVPVDIQLRVILKRKADAGQTAGIEIYSVRPKDVSSPDSVGATGDWISLEGPKAWNGLAFAQDVIQSGTAPVGVLTGCLAPYFGGTPENEKNVADRCRLSKDNTVQVKYDYCVDGVKAAGAKQPTNPVNPNQPECKKFDGAGNNWCGYASAEECLNYGDYDKQKCFDSLSALGKEKADTLKAGGLTKEILNAFFDANGLAEKTGELFVSKKAYDEFLKTPANANKPLCFRTYNLGTDGKFYDPAPDAKEKPLPGVSTKPYWVCTPLHKLDSDKWCVPLENVYSVKDWLPSQCSDATTNPTTKGIDRCTVSVGASNTPKFIYKCRDVAGAKESTNSINVPDWHASCTFDDKNSAGNCKTGGKYTLTCVLKYQSTTEHICAAEGQIKADGVDGCMPIAGDISECETGYHCYNKKCTKTE